MKFNNAFFEELGNSAGVVDLVKQAAEDVAATARATAPVDSGAYRDSIHVEVIPNRKTRTVALVVADDPKTMLIESKTGNLARALKGTKKR
ncbi:HK97 gp10 family phage protein [Herbiconiux sp. KACC 21604]|uniref:HK97 gp10 family phage protein n=1 Tax=unclassified Herbiconiux TaxID=2618217 RepID=UPI001492005A|nr:HK97 gp10 family phage protein [Herbiconiux sp. SALV-R1]QJU52931.1 HK97 gp10 family phage protein [Herbiconiux sp. SALV-R1]WPO87851.1 HK97 gp10 family phage protein [Herbiconiux sp. KACC 21604]